MGVNPLIRSAGLRRRRGVSWERRKAQVPGLKAETPCAGGRFRSTKYCFVVCSDDYLAVI